MEIIQLSFHLEQQLIEKAVIHALSLSKNKDELLNIIERIVNIEQK